MGTFSWLWPTEGWQQSLSAVVPKLAAEGAFLAVLLAATLLTIASDAPKRWVGFAGTHLIRFSRVLSSVVARPFDWLLKIDPRNGQPNTPRFSIWIAINLLAAIACEVSIAVYAQLAVLWSAVTAVVALAVIDLILLSGAYWALRESIEIMNGDKAYMRRQFNDLSLVKNLPFICTTGLLFILLCASGLHWAQAERGVPLVLVTNDTGIAFANFLVATVEAIPFLSFYMSLPSLSSDVSFAPGPGQWTYHLLNTIGSVLVVGTVIGFVQHQLALRRLVEDLLTKTDERTLALLRQRFLRAPSAIKSFVRAAFIASTDDERSIAVAQLALDKHSFSFPALFVGMYSGLTPVVRETSSPIVAEFLDRKAHQFDAAMLHRTINAGQRAYARRALPTPDDRRRIGRILLPAFEQMLRTTTSDHARLARAAATTVPGRTLLCSLIAPGADPAIQQRVAAVLIETNGYLALPNALRCMAISESQLREKIAAWAKRMLTSGMTFAKAGVSELLDNTIRTIDWITYNVSLTESERDDLAAARAGAVARQKSAA